MTLYTKYRNALSIKTIRDLALWPPFQNARHILLSTFNAAKLPEDDPEAPADLLPQTGNYATERVYYNSVFLTELHETEDLMTLGATNEEVDINSDLNTWYTRPAYGVLLRTEQAWYAQGVTLGQLLHSVALAPGESTRIAVIDWTRRTFGSEAGNVDEQEDLTASSSQRRSITEVTSAVASETQSGSSTMRSRSNSRSSGHTQSASFIFSSVGDSSSSSSNNDFATNVSRSSGTRNMSAQTSQNISTRTEQHATSARSRRTSMIKETFEQENEKIATRVVTNYNHMHAMSIQYYEVVQAYRVVTRADHFERVLFIPIMSKS
ncbi:MAG: hypothetical protein JXR84_16140 [Anaerolineae bacterium]|nr:hypothetical protein [Anaerolineae bacterium]